MTKISEKQIKLAVGNHEGLQGEITASIRLENISSFISGLFDSILVHEMTGNGVSSVAQNYRIFIAFVDLYREQIKELEKQNQKNTNRILKLEEKIKRSRGKKCLCRK